MSRLLRVRAALALAVVLAAAVAVAGCQRKVTLQAEDSDTTATIPADSLDALMNEVRQSWEQGGKDDESAEMTALALYEDLRRREPEEWRARSEELLDSLGVGSESAGVPCALLVNLFLRSDPARGSWPYLFWCDAKGPRWQALEGKGLRLLAAAAVPGGSEGKDRAPERFAALYARSRNGRPEPILFAWGRGAKADPWSVVQTLGADSLGGFGGGAFEVDADSLDLVVRTYRTLQRFDECATCPHAYWTHRFRWGPQGFTRRGSQSVPSVYATFVRFVDALVNGREDPALFTVGGVPVEQARALEWDRPKGVWRIAPGSDAEGSELTLFRGQQESYRVTFEPRAGDWLISSIEVVPRSVD